MSSLMLLPTGVPVGYTGQEAPAFIYAPFYAEAKTYGSPSIQRDAVVAPGQYQKVYASWDFPVDPVYWKPMTAHPVVRAEAPLFDYRIDLANTRQDKKRKVFVAPTFYLDVRAPTLDEVRNFMSAG